MCAGYFTRSFRAIARRPSPEATGQTRGPISARRGPRFQTKGGSDAGRSIAQTISFYCPRNAMAAASPSSIATSTARFARSSSPCASRLAVLLKKAGFNTLEVGQLKQRKAVVRFGIPGNLSNSCRHGRGVYRSSARSKRYLPLTGHPHRCHGRLSSQARRDANLPRSALATALPTTDFACGRKPCC